MTKVLKLTVDYDGFYGGNVHEHILLPLDVNGVLFEWLNETNYNDAVYLGEIEGKHSEVYGDLIVEIIDLDSLSLKEASDLIKKSDYDTFESTFEGWEEEYFDDAEHGSGYDEDEHQAIKDKYKTEEVSGYHYTITSRVHNTFIKTLADRYVTNFKTITVREKDYENALLAISEFSIKTH